MTTGTKSVLFGVHCPLIHPWFVALAWGRLYGFPARPQLWLAFFIHDLGYWGKHRMDDDIGETHPELGAAIMGRVFGKEWGDFVRYHSRFYAKRDKRPFSRLCLADKYALCLTPFWLYLPLAKLSGELAEYRHIGADTSGKYGGIHNQRNEREWYYGVQTYLRQWVRENKDRAEHE